MSNHKGNNDKMQVRERLTRVETLVEETRDDVKTIMLNHLPHLNKRLDKFYWIFLGGIISILTGIMILFLKGLDKI